MSVTIAGNGLTIPDASIPGRTLTADAEIARSQMAQVAYHETPIRFTDLRTWDAFATLLPGTAATDDLALITGTPGTDALEVQAGDVKAAGSSSRKAGFQLVVPDNWEDGQSLEVRINAGMETTVADNSCTVDLEAWLPSAPTTDLVATAAQDMNSLTAADFDFALTITTIDPSDILLCVVTIAYNDAATGTAVTPVIYSIARRCDTRG